jgi:uncharacterized membrane protein (DUF2068 family)
VTHRSKTAGQASSGSGLYFIGVYKLFESILFLAAGFGALHLLHKDMETVVTHWVHVLRADPDNRYIHELMAKAFVISPKQLKELSAGTFFYAALRFLEGLGLVLRKRWGEYLTITATALFVPLEVWELARRFTALKLGALIINIAIVLYLAWGLRRKHPEQIGARTDTAQNRATSEGSA